MRERVRDRDIDRERQERGGGGGGKESKKGGRPGRTAAWMRTNWRNDCIHNFIERKKDLVSVRAILLHLWISSTWLEDQRLVVQQEVAMYAALKKNKKDSLSPLMSLPTASLHGQNS